MCHTSPKLRVREDGTLVSAGRLGEVLGCFNNRSTQIASISGAEWHTVCGFSRSDSDSPPVVSLGGSERPWEFPHVKKALRQDYLLCYCPELRA